MAFKCSDETSESFIPFGDPVPESKLRDTSERELGETPESKKQCLEKLKALIKDHNLACVTTEDFLLRFLRVRKFDIKRSFEAIQNYAHHRVALQDLLLQFRPETMEAVLRHMICGCLPYRDADGRIVIFYRSGIWSADICTDAMMIVSMFLLFNYVAEEETSQITGVVLLVDHNRFSLVHINLIMKHANFMKTFLLNCLPIRYSKIHVINEPSAIKYVMMLLGPFIPNKMKERMMFHGTNREILFQYISPTMLPEEFDGSLGHLCNDHMIERMNGYIEKIKDEQRCFLGAKC